MVDEIIEIQKFFSKMTWAIDLFIQNIDVPTEVTLKVNAAPVFTKQVNSIETIWKKCLEYTEQAIINNNHLSSSFQSQYELFYQSVLDKHYKGFIRTTSKEKFDEIQERIAREDFDVVHARYVALHDEYKAVLFDLLIIFQAEVKNIITKQTTQPIDESEENLKRSSNNKVEIKLKTIPSTFEEIFNESDYKKYIDALIFTNPPLLNDKWEFIGKKKGGTGEVGRWIAYLRLTGKINQNTSRHQAATIFSGNIKNLSFGKDARIIEYDSRAESPIFKQLIKYTKLDILPK